MVLMLVSAILADAADTMGQNAEHALARRILDATGVRGGLVVHVPYTALQCELSALSADTGETLWNRDCHSWTYGFPPDLFVIDGLVWIHDARPYAMVGLELASGKETKRFSATEAMETTHHHRCYREKATERFILTARRGVPGRGDRRSSSGAPPLPKLCFAREELPHGPSVSGEPPMNPPRLLHAALLSLLLTAARPALGAEPPKDATRTLDLGAGVTLELVAIPPGEFRMGSTAHERAWATGIEGGATPGTNREKPEGESRPARVEHGFWMGRTEVSVGQFRRFVEETGYVTDAEKPGGQTQCFDPDWDGYHLATKVVNPWKPMPGKSWRDPNFAFPLRSVYPVVCVSWNDGRAFCRWLTDRERAAGRLGEGLEYRLPTEAEWEYACRGGSRESLSFWWGNEIEDGQGRLNISAIDFLPGRDKTWPLAKAPWSDGFAFVSPVDHYGERGRNGFGLADMCGGVWEIVLDHFDPHGAHEEPYFVETNARPVCRGGNYFDVPGNARCAVRLGLRGPSYSDSRDGFRIALGIPRG